MKKFVFFMIALGVLLVGCSSEQLSVVEVQSVPGEVQDVIDLDAGLQLIQDGEEVKYILYKNHKVVTADVQLDGDTLKVMLTHHEDERSGEVQYMFKVTDGKAKYEAINVFIDGEEATFDNVTGI